ncbi:MAG: hypothetical protein QM791_23755 [Ferruginibacter sp.]
MNAITEAMEIILGKKSEGYYLAGFFFSFLAILLSLYMHSRKRDRSSEKTPEGFSWKFLLWDNFKRIFASLICMFLLFRLFDLSNPAAMIGVGFCVGFGVDKLIEFLMERTNIMNFLKPDRKKDSSNE